MKARTFTSFLIKATSLIIISCNVKSTEPLPGTKLIALSDKNTWNYEGIWYYKGRIAKNTFTQIMTAAGQDRAGNFIGYE
jgi:hypothetical protein